MIRRVPSGTKQDQPPLCTAMEALTGRMVKRYRLDERRFEADAASAFPGEQN